MVIVLAGENDFARTQALDALIAGFDGHVERLDGDTLGTPDLADIFTGQTLFATKRFVVIRQLSDNKILWDSLADWISQASADTTIVLIEPKLDKRSRGYKALRADATIKEFAPWTTRDTHDAVRWLDSYAKTQGLPLTDKQARLLISRIGVDQWQLHHAVQKLLLVDSIDESTIINLIDANPDDNVFALFETALRADMDELEHQINSLMSSEDAYRVFGLLNSQLLQLSALATASDRPTQQVASDIGASPYVLSKLMPYATRIGISEVRDMLTLAADTDTQMKSVSIEPWLLVASFLQKIARR